MVPFFSLYGKVKIPSPSSPPNFRCPLFWFLKNEIPALFAYIEGVSVFDALFAVF